MVIAGTTIADDSWGRAKDKIKEVCSYLLCGNIAGVRVLPSPQNAMLMLMGSAEELPQAPAERPRFIEDMSDSEAVAAVSLVHSTLLIH